MIEYTVTLLAREELKSAELELFENEPELKMIRGGCSEHRYRIMIVAPKDLAFSQGLRRCICDALTDVFKELGGGVIEIAPVTPDVHLN